MNATDMESFIRLLGLDPTDTLGNVVMDHQGPSPSVQVSTGPAKSRGDRVEVPVAVSVGSLRWAGRALVSLEGYPTYWAHGDGDALDGAPAQLEALRKIAPRIWPELLNAVRAATPVKVVCDEPRPHGRTAELPGAFDVPVSAVRGEWSWNGVVIVGGDRKFVAFRDPHCGLPGATPPELEDMDRSNGLIKRVKAAAVAAVPAPEAASLDPLVQACCDFIRAVNSDSGLEEAAVQLDDQLHEAEGRFGWDL